MAEEANAAPQPAGDGLDPVDDPADVATETPLLSVTVVTPHNKHVPLDAPLSTADSLISVRECLFGMPETCHFTSYDFVFLQKDPAGGSGPKGKGPKLVPLKSAGTEVNDYLEFAQVPGLENVEHVYLKMVPKRYTLRAVREHVWRLRKIVANPPVPQRPHPMFENGASTAQSNETAATGATAATAATTAQASATPASHDSATASTTADTNTSDTAAQDTAGAQEASSAATDVAAQPAEENSSGPTKPQQLVQHYLNFDRFHAQQVKAFKEVQAKFPNQAIPVPSKLTQLHDYFANGLLGPANDTSTGERHKYNQQRQSRKKGKGKSGKGRGDAGSSTNRCFRSICFSGFNPPPMQRQVLGDLCYLELCTTEGNTYVLTATPHGFFVNSSRDQDVFSPYPAHSPHKSNTLLELLSKVSPSFRSNWAAALEHAEATASQLTDDPAFLTLPWAPNIAANDVYTNSDEHSWLAAEPQSHTFDLNRSEEALSGLGAEKSSFGAIRDWNEEYQCCKELPIATPQDRIFRARALSKMMYEFRQAAQEGAIAVMQGKIAPINPHDEPRCYVFVLNNIFFSFAVDVRGIFGDCGGDRTAAAVAKRDLEGVRILNRLDIPGLHTLATVVIDYLGHRIVAQSIVPGILQGEQASSLEYGSVDRGRTLHFSKEMDDIMSQVADYLFIESSEIVANEEPLSSGADTIAPGGVDAAVQLEESKENKFRVKKGETVKFRGPVDSKGIIGSDARHYILDVLRLAPKDPNYAANPKATPDAQYTAVFRHELMVNYRQFSVQQQQLEVKKSVQAKGEGEADSPESESPKLKDAGDATKAAAEEEDTSQLDAAMKAAVASGLHIAKFDINMFTEHKHALTPEEVAGREAQIRQVADFLTSKVIPMFATSLLRGNGSVGDGESLVLAMHKAGINVRYLGAVANSVHSGGSTAPQEVSTALAAALAENGKFAVVIAEIEMVTRAVKGFAGEILRSDRDLLDAPAVFFAALLNSLVSRTAYSRGDFTSAGEEGNADSTSGHSGKRRDYTGNGNKNSGGKANRKKHSHHDKYGSLPHTPSPSEEVAYAQVARLQLDPANLWKQIRKRVQEKFDYTLRYIVQSEIDEATANSDKNIDADLSAHRVQLVRRVCQKCGFSLAARDDYRWDSAEPVRTEDVVRVFPVCKDSSPSSPFRDIQHYIESGQLMSQVGQLQQGYDFVHEALVQLYQICGASHLDTAVCYQTLGRILAQGGDKSSVLYQKRAVALFTKLRGRDHFETASALATLGIFQHKNGDTKGALESLRRSIYLVQLVSGPLSAQTGLYYQNMGVMYHEVGQSAMAIACFRESLRRTRARDATATATTMQLLAQSYFRAGEYAQAFELQKKAHKTVETLYGSDDERTKNAAKALEKLQNVAVAAKHFDRHKVHEATAQAVRDQQAFLHAAEKKKKNNSGGRSSGGGKKKKKKKKKR